MHLCECLAVSIQDCRRYQTDMLVSAAVKHLHRRTNMLCRHLGASLGLACTIYALGSTPMASTKVQVLKDLTMASVDTDTYTINQLSVPWLLPLQGIILLCMACSQRPGKSQEISPCFQYHNVIIIAKNLTIANNYLFLDIFHILLPIHQVEYCSISIRKILIPDLRLMIT